MTINGYDTRLQPELAKQQIGFLPQHPPLYLDFTVDEYLCYTAQLRLMNKSAIRPAVEEVKEKCQIAHFSSRLLKNLSGGYRQRVGIAQAIIHKPKLVVLDEPTNGLDPNQLIEARKLIREIGKNCTVLLSSHIMSEIHLLCQEVIMIESGRMIFSDSMDAFNNYLHSNTLLASFEHVPDLLVLQQIPGVAEANYTGERQVQVKFEKDDGISERIIAASILHQWRLREISFEKGVLDDVFKHISAQSKR